METTFRPIPLTIIDLLGILLPGYVVFVLIVATLCLFVGPQDVIPPIAALILLGKAEQEIGSATVSITSILIAATLIGYIVKPLGMRPARWLATYWYRFWSHHRNKLRPPESPPIECPNPFCFPFAAAFGAKPYFSVLQERLSERV